MQEVKIVKKVSCIYIYMYIYKYIYIYMRMRMLQSEESTGFIRIFRLCTDNLCQPYKKSQKIKVKSKTKLKIKTSRTMMIEMIKGGAASG